MAYDKIITVRSRLDHCVDYVLNHEKTDMAAVLDYIGQQNKNTLPDGRSVLETAINCNLESAYQDMQETKRRWRQLEELGYTVKRGPNIKHTAVKPPGGQRFFRLDGLGDGYTEADIQARLSAARSGEAPPPVPLGPPFCPAVQPLTPGRHTRQDPEAERLSCPLLQIPVSAGGHPETASQAPVCLPDGDHQI